LTRKSGIASVVFDTGTGATVRTRTPTPTCRPSGCPSSMVSAKTSGGSSTATRGNQITPPSVVRSAPPSAASTNAISACR